ncbi:flagellar hook-associated 2 domain protein [Clostridium sp. CAG:167]|nr:flagellar hook-associated 2 domain protein [Clostridium sp. CAG:167]
MGIRMSGLSSGMDTEAIVKELMSAQSLKKNKVVKAKTKLEWTQTKWADLNTKLTGLYNNFVTKMQLSTAYKTKKTTISDTSKASVSAKTNAVNGSYTMEVKNIATAQYLTGAKIDASATDKLVDLDSSLLNKEISITTGGTTTKFAVTADTTLKDFTSALQNAGLNASFDDAQKRIFISSKDSGVANTFSISTSGLSNAEVTARGALCEAAGYSNMSNTNKASFDEAMQALQTSGVGTDDYNKALDTIAKLSYDTKKASADTAAETYVKAKLYSEKYSEYEEKARESLKNTYLDDDGNLKTGKTQEDYDKAVAKKADTDTVSYISSQLKEDDVKLQIEEAAFSGKTEADMADFSEKAVSKYYSSGVKAFTGMDGVDEDSEKTRMAAYTEKYASVTDRNEALSSSALTSLGLADISVDADGKVTVNGGANDSANTSIPTGMALIEGSDSKIILNGAELTSSSSVVSANGLEISLTSVTKENESVTFSVATDTDAIYDSVKSFLKEYNSVMKEMNTLYNADSAKGYEPLTSQEKEAMSDDEVKEWETKIKNSLLRSDSTLGSIINAMRSAMQTTVEYDGGTYALSSLGIMTSTDYTEGGLLHIYGDPDDSVYSAKDDKLKKALEENPDVVIATLTGVFGNLRQTMSDKMAGSKYSSSMTFYNDIKMKSDVKDYESDIKDWEDKLAEMEDAYYSKFTAMETALAKLQSQQSTMSGLFSS